jgi:hypothetical protein
LSEPSERVGLHWGRLGIGKGSCCH